MTERSLIQDLFGVEGKVVLITGGSAGIGESLADGFVRAGARVYVSSRKADVCAATAAALSEHGECIALPADIGSAEGRATVVEELTRRETRLDVLINNAGTMWAAPLAEYPESAWDKVYDVNVKGPFFLVQGLLPLLVAAATREDPARIITVGSIQGFSVPTHETYAYSSSKAAMHQLGRHLARRLAELNITSNVIAPGMFPSKMMEATIAARGEDAVLERVPLKKFVGPADMSGAAIYLASKAGAAVTGMILTVDGGTATTL